MKRTVTLLTLLLAVMLAVACALPFGLPGENVTSGTAQTSGGDVLAVENRQLVSRIYTLRNRVITQVYEEVRIQNGMESEIVRVAVDQKVYFIRAFADGVEWELLKLEDDTAMSVSRGAFEKSAKITGLTAHNGTFWITTMNVDGTASVYECGSSGGELKMLIPAQWVADVVTAEYDGTQLRAITRYDEVCVIAQDGSRKYSDAAAEKTVQQPVADIVGWLLCKQNVLGAVAVFWLVVALSVLLAAAINRGARRLATRLAAVGGEILLLVLLGTVCLVSYQMLYVSGVMMMLQTLIVMGVASAGILLVSVLALRIAAVRMTRTLPELVRQMNDVAEGHVDFREVTRGKDELNRMNQAMQEMCMSLSVRNYELESTVRSYQRFVPEKLTELLDRASVAEVILGDSRWVTGNIGLFSVGNREIARDNLEDDAFVEFINHSLGIFQECLSENRGSMISSGLRLSAMETMFPYAAEDGVQAGLDFLGKAQKGNNDGIPAPQPFLILHRASFLYGVAGQEDRLFPYLSSGEMEFLGSYAQQLYQVGVRLVVTESYLKQMERNGCTTRYIGFVADEERGAYKLYEVLDAYPELEKKVRIHYDRQFQDAIDLFYRNDFFLARNLFSGLLRECPEDGIARWYLFACEHYFNQEGPYEADYQLFGVHEG